MFGIKKVKTEDIPMEDGGIKLNRAGDTIRVTWPKAGPILGLVFSDKQAVDLATKLVGMTVLPVDEEFGKSFCLSANQHRQEALRKAES